MVSYYTNDYAQSSMYSVDNSETDNETISAKMRTL